MHLQGCSWADLSLVLSLKYVLHLYSSFEEKVTLWQFLEMGILLLGQWDCPVDKDSPRALSVIQLLILSWNLQSFFQLLDLASRSLEMRNNYGLITIQNRTTVWSSTPTGGHVSGENHSLKRFTHPSVHCSNCSTICNSQDMEAT